MHDWRFLIPVLAVLGLVTSFAELSSIDGRGQSIVRRELTRSGTDQRFDASERSCKGLEFDGEYTNVPGTQRVRRTVRSDRRISSGRQPTEREHQSRIIRDIRQNKGSDYRSSCHRTDSRREDRRSHRYEDARNYVRIFQDSPNRERTLVVHRRNAGRTESRTKTHLRADSRIHVRTGEDLSRRINTDNIRVVESDRTRINRDSDSTRKISRQTRDARKTDRLLATQVRNNELISAKRLIRREEYRNSRDITSGKDRRDIRTDRFLSARRTPVLASEDIRTKRPRARTTPESTGVVTVRMDGRDHYSGQSQVGVRATPEHARNTGHILSTSRRVGLVKSRSNVDNAQVHRARIRVTAGDSPNVQEARNKIDHTTRSGESLLSRQNRITQSQVHTQTTPQNNGLVSDTLDKRIRNSARQDGQQKHSSERTGNLYDRRRKIRERRTELVRTRSTSESRAVRGHRFDGRVERVVASRARVRSRSEEPLSIQQRNRRRLLLGRELKAARESSQREFDRNRLSKRSVRYSRSERYGIFEGVTPSPEHNSRFNQETRDSRTLPKDQQNRAQEYSEKHIEDTLIVTEWTTLTFYFLQGIYVCVLLYQMTGKTSNKNTKLGFYSRTSNAGKLVKLE